MGFKHGRKSTAQQNRERKQAELKEKKEKSRYQSKMMSTGLRFCKIALLPPGDPSDMVTHFDFDLFRFGPVNPIRNRDVLSKFRDLDEYGLFAPFRDEVFFELYTNLDAWRGLTFDEKEFQEWDKAEQQKIIHGFSDVILFLLRVSGFTFFSAPFDLIGSTFQGLHDAGQKSVSLRTRLRESMLDPIALPSHNPKQPTDNEFQWIKDSFVATYRENHQGRFNFLFEIYESLHFPNPGMQLVQIWAGIENIVKSSRRNVKRSIRSRCAMILGQSLDQQREIYQHVGRLYNLRSSVVHGKPLTITDVQNDLEKSDSKVSIVGDSKMLYDSFELLNNLVRTIIDRNSKFFEEDELDRFEEKFAADHKDLFSA